MIFEHTQTRCNHTANEAELDDNATTARRTRRGGRGRIRKRGPRRSAARRLNEAGGATAPWWYVQMHASGLTPIDMIPNEKGFPVILPSTQHVYILQCARNPERASTYVPMCAATTAEEVSTHAHDEYASDDESVSSDHTACSSSSDHTACSSSSSLSSLSSVSSSCSSRWYGVSSASNNALASWCELDEHDGDDGSSWRSAFDNASCVVSHAAFLEAARTASVVIAPPEQTIAADEDADSSSSYSYFSSSPRVVAFDPLTELDVRFLDESDCADEMSLSSSCLSDGRVSARARKVAAALDVEAAAHATRRAQHEARRRRNDRKRERRGTRSADIVDDEEEGALDAILAEHAAQLAHARH